METLDVIIIGSGPCGMACGIEASRKNLSYTILEKGSIVNTIRRYPTNMTFFSTADLLELEHVPFPTTSPNKRPNRQEALEYYVKVAQYFKLNIEQYTKVENINREGEIFTLNTHSGKTYRARNVILAIGYFDEVNKINVPGEEKPHVKHYYDEAYPYVNSNVVVVGGANSAVETALDLYRHGANVSLVHRRDKLAKSIKYWVRPDIENRIKEGAIPTYWNSSVTEIADKEVEVKSMETGDIEKISADFVFLLTGYHPDGNFLQAVGINIDEKIIPEFDDESFETNVPGLYVAGAMVCGCETFNIFIENGRHHAKSIFRDIMNKEKVSG